ncbi:MAG TPA: fatty acid desaturase, partial [Chryseolinea sp.]|nr:fatty acid desaturase [Chryseolinea sp.]
MTFLKEQINSLSIHLTVKKFEAHRRLPAFYFFYLIQSREESTHPKVEYFNLFFYKAIYYFLFIVLPLLVMGLTWWQFIIGFVAMHFAEGLVLGLVFQLAHVVEDTEIRYAENNSIEDSWAVHQLKTTANFAPTNKLANFLCGGLNLQVEHHLFPK